MYASKLISGVLVSVLSVAAFACAAPSSGGSDDEATAGALTGSAAATSEKLEKQLFDDVQPNGEVTNYSLVGNLAGSREACKVEIHRASLHPQENNWSHVRIVPLGRSRANMEGPDQIGWAYNGASDDRLAIEVSGDTVTWSETESRDQHKTLKGIFKFKGSHRYDKLDSFALNGDTLVGHADIKCENLKAVFQMKKADIKTVEKARDKWGTDNSEDVSSLEYEGCELKSAKRLGCTFGNDTNEETLDLIFEVTDGAIGRMVHADRQSNY